MDDAEGGRRGLRAEPSAELLATLAEYYGVVPRHEPMDLGGSSNLNLLIDDGTRKYVMRVYRPSVSADRLADIQDARRQLATAGFRCLTPIPSQTGAPWAKFGARLMELENYVEADGRMNTADRVQEGLRTLGGMHNVLRTLTTTSRASHSPRFVNYVAPDDLVDACRRATARIRAWGPTDDEARLADLAEDLARATTDAYQSLDRSAMTHQLVHGDFWDNNVLYLGRDIVLIHDFDHMGWRARTEDVALTLYFLNAECPAANHVLVQRVRNMVDAYDSALDTPLSPTERAALPVAIVRQPLWSIARWIADLDDEGAARMHASAMLPAIESALEIVRTLPRWQEALT